MLAMNIDQMLSHLTQLLHRRWRTIDPGPRTAVGIDHPTQHEVIIGSQVVSLQPGSHRRQRSNIEQGNDFGLVAARAHHAGLTTLAQGKRQGIDQNRLPRPGFPGQNGKTRGKLEFQPIDNDKIT